MTVQEMHYDFKVKANKVDSLRNANYLIPEIDWLLNEAQELFVKMVAEPRFGRWNGFELTQRSRDDIRTLVQTQSLTRDGDTSDSPYGYPTVKVNEPDNYMSFVRAHAFCSDKECVNVSCTCHMRQHDDLNHVSPFDRSDLHWKELNLLEAGRTFWVEMPSMDSELHSLNLTYIRKPRYVHYAEGFNRMDGYTLPSGVKLEGSSDCELPEHTHREIVDIAVMVASGQWNASRFNLAAQKLSLNQTLNG